MTPRPKRTMYFAAVTAEESGLLGSAFLARHPPCLTKQLVANFNIDGLNIWGATHDIEMVGHGKNSLSALAEAVAARRGRKVMPNQEPDKGLFYRSDHFWFAKVGVPAFCVHMGNRIAGRSEEEGQKLMRRYSSSHYHHPSDEYKPDWDFAGME